MAIVLPPGEAFSAGASGAISLLVHRLVSVAGRLGCVVLGGPVERPFTDVVFREVRPGFGLGGRAARYAAAVARALRAIRPILVEVHNRPDVALILARRLSPVPVVLFLHNDPQGMRQARTAGQRGVLLARLAGVVTVSAYLRGRLLDGVPGGSVAVLPNCIDLGGMPVPSAVRDRLILFAGRVVADKGADAFVAACAQALPLLPGWRAEMIGADRFGPDSPETPFLRALRPRAAAAGVAMRGYQPHVSVLEAMARAAIVVVPSRWAEPFGLTALEAMGSGAALLCSGRGGLGEVMGDVGVAVDPDDPGGMARQIVELARDPDRRARLGKAGRARARAFDAGPASAALEAFRAGILHSGANRPI